jgi:hypothetical protein
MLGILAAVLSSKIPLECFLFIILKNTVLIKASLVLGGDPNISCFADILRHPGAQCSIKLGKGKGVLLHTVLFFFNEHEKIKNIWRRGLIRITKYIYT